METMSMGLVLPLQIACAAVTMSHMPAHLPEAYQLQGCTQKLDAMFPGTYELLLNPPSLAVPAFPPGVGLVHVIQMMWLW